MPSVNKSADLPASPEAVWEKLTDFSSYGEWMSVHVAFPDGPPAAVAPDTSFKEKVKIMGMPGEVNWTIKQVDAPNTLVMEGKGPMGTFMKSSYNVSAVDGGARLDIENEFGGAALGPMSGALTKESDKALDESLAKLKDLVG